uniref:Hirustasin-like factor 6 n=1 Tax=Hirudo verbana TaxID=311461 RepID=A0A7T0KBT7_9ANNE|nr:hirustasin-like factor 6 [Hirudo verbana]
MKAALLFCVLLIVVLASSTEDVETGLQCGDEICTEAQVCDEGRCVCSLAQCRKRCQYGFKVDSHGCQYFCTCNERPTSA